MGTGKDSPSPFPLPVKGEGAFARASATMRAAIFKMSKNADGDKRHRIFSLCPRAQSDNQSEKIYQGSERKSGAAELGELKEPKELFERGETDEQFER